MNTTASPSTTSRPPDARGIGKGEGPLRVLIWMPEYNRIPGGHCTQVEKTAEALREIGVTVEVTHEEACDVGYLRGFDIVHGFGMKPDHFRITRAAGVPVAISSVYWRRSYLMADDDRGQPLRRTVRRARKGLSLLRSSLRGVLGDHLERMGEPYTSRRVQFELADVLIPNSLSEARAIVDDLGVSTPMHVAPNAADPGRFYPNPDIAHSDKRDVLMAGRFEPHKNQLGLIRAMRGHEIAVRLIGPPHPDHGDYYAACRRAARGNIKLLDPVDHYEQLLEIYQRARVHALPSWYETTGLVSLEAALAGANIVTTDRGDTKDYFDGVAWFCDPAKPKTIRRAVERAYAAPPNDALRERVLDRFTWRQTAVHTLEAYRVALSAPRSHDAV